MRNVMRILKFAFVFIGLLWLAGQVTPHKPAALVPVVQAASTIDQPPLVDGDTIRPRTYTPAHSDQVNHRWSDYAVAQGFSSGQIQGQVVGSAGPLPMIVVTLEQYNATSTNGSWVIVGTTQIDEQGHYAFLRLPAGHYRVQAVDPTGRYAMAYYNVSPAPATFTALDLQADETLTGIDLFLYRTGLIRGIVTNLQGEPLRNMKISAMHYVTGTWGSGYENSGEAFTDAAGSYVIENLTAGLYRVMFFDPAQVYVTEYNNDAFTHYTAPFLRLHESEVLLGIDAAMGRPATMYGRVTTEAGEPLPGIWVSPWWRDERDGGFQYELSGFAETDASGQYTLSISTRGLHRIGFLDSRSRYQTEFYDNRATLEEALEITVTPELLLVGVDAALAPAHPITPGGSNQPPVAEADLIVVRHSGSTQTLVSGATSVLANDHDPDGQLLMAQVVQEAQHGQLQLTSTGNFTYTHDGSAAEYDFFTYLATDGELSSNITQVQITIEPLVQFAFTKTVGISGLQPACPATSALRVPVGAEVAYCYTFRNTGQVILTNHTLIDDQIGLLLDQMPEQLLPGAIYTLIVRTVVPISTTNIATWTAQISLPLQTLTTQPPLMVQTDSATVGVSNANDDLDQDSIPDNLEGAADIDHDNQPNYLDQDADNDGWGDAQEAGDDPLHPRDSNNDAWPDYLDAAVPGSNGGYSYRIFVPFYQKGGD